jgi:hypothetical protein
MTGPFMNKQQPSGKAEEAAETEVIDDPAFDPEAFLNAPSFAEGSI